MARYEDIVKAIIEQNDYYRLPQSRIEAILLKIKQVIEEEGGKAKPVKWIGVTTTEITDKSNVNPIMINGATVYAETGNIASYGDSEFIFRGDIWQAFGNMTGYIPDEGNTTDGAFGLSRKTVMIHADNAAEMNSNKKVTVSGATGVDIIGNENGVNIDKLNGYIPNTGNETSDNFVLKRKSLDVRAMNGNAVFMNQADKFLFNVKADKTMHYIQGNGGATPGNEVMTSDKVDTKLNDYIPDTGDAVEGSLSITRTNGAITLTSANPTTQTGGNVVVSPDGGVSINGAGNLTLGMSGNIAGGCGGPINIASAGQGGITFNSNASQAISQKVAFQLNGSDQLKVGVKDVSGSSVRTETDINTTYLNINSPQTTIDGYGVHLDLDTSPDAPDSGLNTLDLDAEPGRLECTVRNMNENWNPNVLSMADVISLRKNLGTQGSPTKHNGVVVDSILVGLVGVRDGQRRAYVNVQEQEAVNIHSVMGTYITGDAFYKGKEIATLDDLVGYLQNNARYQNLSLGSNYSQQNEHSDIALNNTGGSLSTTGTAQVAEFSTNAAGIAEIISRETVVDGENIKLTADIVTGKVTITKYDSLDKETYTLFTVNDGGAYVGAASANTKVMTQADLDAALGNIEAVLNAIV